MRASMKLWLKNLWLIIADYRIVRPHLALPLAASYGVIERAQEAKKIIMATTARIVFIFIPSVYWFGIRVKRT
jgi:hypothetical protein